MAKIIIKSITPLKPKSLPEIENASQILYNKTLEQMTPLLPYKVIYELHGMSTAHANALRRIVLDELPHSTLTVSSILLSEKNKEPIPTKDGYDFSKTTEVFMIPEHVIRQIQTIRIQPLLTDDELKFKLDVINHGHTLKTVYSGDLSLKSGKLPKPIFNPGEPIAAIQPGKRLCIDDISLTTNYGYIQSMYQLATTATLKPLDIKKHTNTQKISLTDADYETQTRAALSDYAESSLVTDSKKFELSYVIPSCPSAEIPRQILMKCVKSIITRLKYIQNIKQTTDMLVISNDLDIVLTVKDTRTIGNILEKEFIDAGVQFAGCNNSYNDKSYTLRIKTPNAETVFNDTIDVAIKRWENLQFRRKNE